MLLYDISVSSRSHGAIRMAVTALAKEFASVAGAQVTDDERA